MSPQLEDIVRKVRSDERIAPAEALVLWHEAPLWLLGELAARSKERVSGDKVYFNRNFHIEHNFFKYKIRKIKSGTIYEHSGSGFVIDKKYYRKEKLNKILECLK
jgi:hypothetical protein